MELLGVRVQTLLAAEQIRDRRIDGSSGGGEFRLALDEFPFTPSELLVIVGGRVRCDHILGLPVLEPDAQVHDAPT